jgi:LEA14-like dessication related protein
MDNHRPPLARLGAVLGVAILSGGCALTHLQAPAITPGSVELTEAALDRQRFTVHLHVENPNDRPLPVKSVSCTLQIEGVDVGKGKSAEPVTVPAHGDADFDMLVETNFVTSVPDVLRRLIQRGDLPQYTFSGWVHPDVALLPPIPFSKSGQIAMR